MLSYIFSFFTVYHVKYISQFAISLFTIFWPGGV